MNPKKILIVEDDLFLRDLYAETLKDEGYTIDTAEDGEIALQKMLPGGWDLVLLDIVLPKLDGIAVMNKLKETPPVTPNKLIVFLTNLDKDDKIKQALTLGSGYLIKSQITPGDLVREVKLYLEKLAPPHTPPVPPVGQPPAAAS